MSGYVVVDDRGVDLDTSSGTTTKEWSFTLPSTADVSAHGILTFKIRTRDVKSDECSFKFVINGSEWEEYTATLQRDSFHTMHEVTSGLKAGTNTVTFEFTSGDGRLNVTDVVVWFRYKETAETYEQTPTPTPTTPTLQGSLHAWGANNWGQLGEGYNVPDRSYGPEIVWGLKVKALDGGHSHCLALLEDSTVQAWGKNDAGQLGNGSTTAYFRPTGVTSLTGVKTIAVGHEHCLAVLENGTVWAWGWNSEGQVGDDTRTNRTTPVQVKGLPPDVKATAVAGGHFHSLAVLEDGSVWAWGDNHVGQLGDNTQTDRLTAVQVKGLPTVKATAVAATELHSLAVLEDGTVWAWGWNDHGQLGDSTTTMRLTAVKVTGLPEIKVKAIAGDGWHSLALLEDGTVRAWGWNGYGQLGDGTNTDRRTPVQVSGIPEVKAIDAGGYHSLALLKDGTVRAWGLNDWGQLGDGTNTTRSAPVTLWDLYGIKAIGASGWHSLACG